MEDGFPMTKIRSESEQEKYETPLKKNKIHWKGDLHTHLLLSNPMKDESIYTAKTILIRSCSSRLGGDEM